MESCLESCLSTFQVDVRSAPAVRPVWRLDPPKGRMHKTPTVYVPVSVSQPPFSTNDGQLRSVYRLGKTCVDSGRPKATTSNTNLVFLSLHDVKDHKGPNEFQTSRRPSTSPVTAWWSPPASPAGEAEDVQSNNPAGEPNEAPPNLVEPAGLEPATPCLQSRCSPN